MTPNSSRQYARAAFQVFTLGLPQLEAFLEGRKAERGVAELAEPLLHTPELRDWLVSTIRAFDAIRTLEERPSAAREAGAGSQED
jgi:hypothetical protein